MSSAIIENDMAAARAEARGQYGALANAEELIRAHAASISPEVRAASRKPLNEEATRTLDRSSIEVPEGGKLVDAVVRGNTISYIWEDEQGLWHKAATGYDDSYEVEFDPAQEIAHEQARQHVAQRSEVIDWRAEMDEKLAEMRQEMEAEHAQKLADLREEHQAEIEKLAKEQGESSEQTRGGTRVRKSASAKSRSKSKSKTTTRKGGSARSRSQSQMDKQQAERKVSEG